MFLGRYQIGERTSGSFGHVFAVIDAETAEPRALKLAGNGADTLLLDELAVLARLHHPSLPRVFEVGRTTEAIADVPAGAPFFVAEWIAGGRCDADGRRWTDPRAVWSLLADVAGALAVIHAAGLVHGDVGPQNILLSGSRAILVDLGLAMAAGARGTPAYMAPEAFAGRVEPRSDVYSLGATVARLVLGHPPFEAATLGELVHAVATKPAPALPLPAPLADLVARLMARDPAMRPSSALAILDELDQIAAAIAPGLERRARPSVGAPPAPASWPGARELADAIARGLEAGRVQIVVGDAASGARELVDSALLAWQIARVAERDGAPAIAIGTLDALAAGRVGRAGGRDASDASAAGWIELAARAIRGDTSRACAIELADDPRADAVVAALVRATGGAAIAIVARPPREVDPDANVDVHVVAPLDDAGLAAIARDMLGREPPRAWVAGLRAASAGHALAAIELVRATAGEADPFAVEWSARSTATIAELRARALRAMPANARRLAIALAAWGGRARIEGALATARAVDAVGDDVGFDAIVELERAGLARRRGDELWLDRATRDAIDSIGDDLAPAALAGLAIADGDDDDDRVVELLLRAPIDDALADRVLDVAAAVLARGRGDRARCLAARVQGGRARLIEARAAAATGAYRDAVELARAAETAGADPIAARLVAARAAQRAGELDAAEAELAALFARAPHDVDVAGAYARLLVTRSRYADAKRVVGDLPLAGLRAEAAGLAAFYLGELDDADRAFAALEVSAAASGEPAATGRAMSLRGMVAQQRGQLGLASDRYREAARRLGDAGEIHAAATAELNL
ncbi:MAG TPA: serine/threonine-protein kinase, partial [Kofleriaceae bacterium]|nr:serine/threonine-protein kinase [Kofleriaceae bacterium]